MFEARFKWTLEELQFLTLGLCQRRSPRKRWLACRWSPPKQLEAAFTLCIWLKVASIVIKVCLQLKYWGQCVARKTWLIRINKPKVQQEKTPSITPLLVLTICTRQVGPLIHAADSESWAVNNRRAASSGRTDLFSSGEPLHHISASTCAGLRDVQRCFSAQHSYKEWRSGSTQRSRRLIFPILTFVDIHRSSWHVSASLHAQSHMFGYHRITQVSLFMSTFKNKCWPKCCITEHK